MKEVPAGYEEKPFHCEDSPAVEQVVWKGCSLPSWRLSRPDLLQLHYCFGSIPYQYSYTGKVILLQVLLHLVSSIVYFQFICYTRYQFNFITFEHHLHLYGDSNLFGRQAGMHVLPCFLQHQLSEISSVLLLCFFKWHSQCVIFSNILYVFFKKNIFQYMNIYIRIVTASTTIFARVQFYAHHL